MRSFFLPRGEFGARFGADLTKKIMGILEDARKAIGRSSGQLKNVITGNLLEVEKKFHDAIQTLNFVNMFVISNQEIPVWVESTERRFEVFRVSDKYLNNTEYCARIFELFSSPRNAAKTGAELYEHLVSIPSTFQTYVTPELEEIKRKCTAAAKNKKDNVLDWFRAVDEHNPPMFFPAANNHPGWWHHVLYGEYEQFCNSKNQPAALMVDWKNDVLELFRKADMRVQRTSMKQRNKLCVGLQKKIRERVRLPTTWMMLNKEPTGESTSSTAKASRSPWK